MAEDVEDAGRVCATFHRPGGSEEGSDSTTG
jgi:hypothetical protein